ncbi:MAG: zinc ribbon domain-containing protein [Anaerolineae bacterium]|jgi:putative FmdB family regulatory protein|nr:zinc ribbon domain-containing protein [Anaerolineae bacterium]MCZ7553550.1 hypothetical protein [Anaerolineales bacterium]
MPIYEYVCLDCRNQFEQVRLMKDVDEPIACAKCASLHTARTLSLFFASSGGKAVAGGAGACAGCASRSCSTCGH